MRAMTFIRKKLLAVLGTKPTRSIGISLQEKICTRAISCTISPLWRLALEHLGFQQPVANKRLTGFTEL
jgi:hypothetical protein